MPMPAVLEDTRSRPASPKRVLFRVVATIFIVEALIMVALHAVGDSLPAWIQELLDPLALVGFTIPILYFLVARPLDRGVRVRDRALEEMRLAGTVFENATEGIIVSDREGIIRSVNASFERITGYSAAEVIGKTPRILKSGRHDRAFYERMWKTLLAQGNWQGEIWNRRKDGEVYPESLSVTAVRDARGELSRFVAIFSQAYHDRLTGLANRHLLFEELKQDAACARRQGTRVGVLFVDVDGFKRVNDLLGHETGDAVLRDVAAHLRGSIRESDLAARWGGDEFVVLLTGLTDPEAAGVVAGKIVEAFRPPSLAERPDVAVSLSIGVAICPEDAEDPHEILRRADAAMYEAKRAGKNTFRRAGPGR